MDGHSNRGSSSVDMFLPNYKMGKTLGIGSFGKVKIAEHALTGHKVAIKILNRRKIKNMEMEEKVRREIKILRLFMHPHIIRLYEVIETPSDIYVVMEYVKSGELFDYIVEKGRLQEDEARNFFQQIISGVEYCHRNMVVHRDLKPENLLLDSKCNVKIADFGLSNIMRDGHFLKTSCGSPNYAAPEVISGKLYAGPEVDVWSCGVILYALLCGTLPFDDENIPNLFKKIKGGIYTLPSHLSAGARDLIPRMLVVDPMKRVTIPEIRQHPWFQAHLPRYLAVPPPDTMQQAKKIDEDILQEVVTMGFDRNQLVESLHNRIQNEATVAYYLLLDNRFRIFSGYLGDEFQETVDSGYNRLHSSEAAAPAVGHRLPGYMDYQGMGSRSQFPVERKWALGLQSRAHPREIMTEVLKALQELNVGWKKIGHYNMKCRWIPGNPGHHEGIVNNPGHYFGDDSTIIENDDVNKLPNVVKFEVQLYKTREEKYLLDLQRVQGPQFLFLDLCAAFLAQLRLSKWHHHQNRLLERSSSDRISPFSSGDISVSPITSDRFSRMGEVFEGYERQYCELSANLSRKCSSAVSLDGERKKQKVSEIKAGIDEAESLIRKMDLEARSLQANVKAVLLVKLREYKSDLNNLKTDVKRIASGNSLDARDELMESGMANAMTASADQKAKLLMSTERLNQTGNRIKDSRRTMLETEELGVSILQDLHQQRQSLLHTHDTLHGVDNNIGKSKRVLTAMSRRMSRNKWIIGIIIFVLVLAIILVLYFKLSN